MEKLTFSQRMIQRFHEEIFQRMSPEARARKLSVMRAFAKTMRAKNKENENPLNNNTAPSLGIAFTQSTPLKMPQITNLDEVESDSDWEVLENNSLHDCPVIDEVGKPELVFARIYDPECDSTQCEDESQNTDSETDNSSETVTLEEEDRHWKSLEVLHENAEYEFCRSLEESKLFVSSASLLEEIEADLPSAYSLAKPFYNTFHTVSSYRTQTRLARMVRFGLPSTSEKDMNSTCPEILDPENDSEAKSPNVRMGHLEVEAMVQKALADQAEKALNLSKNQKFLGIQHLESEKALLLAHLRHQAAIQEMKKVKLAKEISKETVFGQVTISDVFFQVEVSPGNSKDLYLCIAIEKENVLSSSVLSDEFGGKLHFNEEFKFDKLREDFVIVLELYKLHFKERKKAILKTALIKKLTRMTPVNTNRSIMYSHYGKSSFVRVTSAELRLDHITKRKNDMCILLNNLTKHLAGSSISVCVKTDIKTNFQLSGFLNVFKQTWHRRWYILSGYFLECWVYPEDRDAGKAPVDFLYLPDFVSATPVGMEVCIRPHCFAINSRSPDEKILFSADSNSDTDQWVKHVNLIIENIFAWRPDVKN